MLSVDLTISRFRRDIVIAFLLRAAMLIAAMACLIGAPVFGMHQNGALLLALIGGAWILLSYRSMQGTRIAAQSPSLIAAGQYEQAEHHIDTALRSFSLFSRAKLLSMHHLALLRHAQRRWREAALLCRALLSQRLGGFRGLSKNTLLLLADSELQMGELTGAYEAMNGLFGYRLNLNESLTLQLLQLDYGSRIGAWDAMLQGLSLKVQLSELMPTLNAARSQALLALAALKSNQAELAQWLRRRAELLVDPQQIAADRPIVAELFAQNPDQRGNR
ncbi:MAG: hypothetical protein ABSG31_06395 [Tepidisphaeraceae bacterium]|jgi:hypothetical protein